jgi:CsoR family transcriptional regulator, copper-sensing transcriptional repressor
MAENVKATVHARLNRIEGQVRGIRRMVDEDRYCIDVLTQVNAAMAALEGVALILLSNHVDRCVRQAVQSGRGEASVRELTEAVGRLVRS